MEYMVLYSSRTGNTRKLAAEIFRALPGTSKDMQEIGEYKGRDADLFFVGFWVDRGTCDISVINLLSGLHGKKVALFGTCGMGGEEYFRAVGQRVSVWIPDDCSCMGTFLCQGKMPMQVREKYEIPMEDPAREECRLRLLRNFDEALLHPDERDMERARSFAADVLEAARELTETGKRR